MFFLPIKLRFVHKDSPYPLIETRRICLTNRTDSASDLFDNLQTAIRARKPSRNRLVKYVVKRVEIIGEGDRNGSDTEHGGRILQERDLCSLISAGDQPVNRTVRLRVVVNEETDEEALLSLSSEDLVSSDVEKYDEYIMDRLHTEDFVSHFANGESSESAILRALKKLPEFLSERVTMLFQKLQPYEQQVLSQGDQSDSGEPPEKEKEEEEQNNEEQEQEEEQEAQEKDEDTKMDTTAIVSEKIKEVEADEPQSEHSDDSILDSFVIVGKDGKRCLDDGLETTDTDSDSPTSSPTLVCEDESADPNAEKLSLMKEMGFEEEEQNREMLLKFDGNLVKAVQEMMMRS